MHLLVKIIMNWKSMREEPVYTDSTVNFVETHVNYLTNFLGIPKSARMLYKGCIKSIGKTSILLT